MDCVSSYSKISFTTLPQFSSFNLQSLQSSPLFKTKKNNSLMANCSSNNSNNTVFNGLTAPLMPTTEAGRSLSGYMHDDKALFYASVEKELERLDRMRNDALLPSVFSLGTDEAILHRRISELRKQECRSAVEDVMYMLIVHKFSEIGVHLVPKLANCMYNGRLEILPRNDYELESIHSVEVLELVKEIGWEDKSGSWGLTQIQKHQIRHVYGVSILYGYFFKSASLRYQLEKSFHITPPTNRSCPLKQKEFGDTELTHANFRTYVSNFDDEIKKMCAQPKCKEANSLIEKHCSALFGDESDEIVSTSFASLKRFVLEAVAFGSFLWDAQHYIGRFYQLETREE